MIQKAPRCEWRFNDTRTYSRLRFDLDLGNGLAINRKERATAGRHIKNETIRSDQKEY
jgi:hypothetical protein